MTTLSLIAALDHDYAIGRGNTLPWHLPEDLKRFKALTLGKPVLMGRKTAQSLGRALPGRLNLVLTRSGGVPFEGMVAVSSVEEALEKSMGAEELMVIGGGEVYAMTLSRADRLYLTHVDARIGNGDAFFPKFNQDQWQVVSRSAGFPKNHNYPFEFVDYVRA